MRAHQQKDTGNRGASGNSCEKASNATQQQIGRAPEAVQR
jgi:hypothetical protein